MESRKCRWILRCIVVITLVVICSNDVTSKRSGGGSRSSSSRRTTSSRRITPTSTRRQSQPNYPRQPQPNYPRQPQPNYPRQPQPNYPRQQPVVPPQPRPHKPFKPKIYKPPKTSRRFNKGGIKKFAKVGLALYLANKMKPSIKFRPYRGFDRNRRASFCYDCMSINGSNIGCERGSRYERLGKCYSSSFRPYCSTEYGRTSDDLPYVRRSCNERRCNTCATKPGNFTGNSTNQCYTIQCEMCNWDNCNGKATQDTFHAQWSACEVDSSRTGALFTDDDRCGSCSVARNLFVTVFVAAFSAFLLH